VQTLVTLWLDLIWKLDCDLCPDCRCGRRVVVVTTVEFRHHVDTVKGDLLEKVECGQGNFPTQPAGCQPLHGAKATPGELPFV
jgi:hypothetical protein